MSKSILPGNPNGVYGGGVAGAPALIPFSFEGTPFRVVDLNGAPAFVAADVCAILDLGNVSMALAKLDDDEKGLSSVDTLGGAQTMLVVTEGGLFTIMLRCRDAMTPGTVPHRFRRWVTGEVLPTIRRTGSYGVAVDPVAVLNDPAAMRGLLLNYADKCLALEAVVKEQAPAVAALDRLAKPTDGAMCITDAAKDLQVRRKDLVKLLEAERWVYRRVGGKRRMVAYQNRLQMGHLEHRLEEVPDSEGASRIVEQVMVTARGRVLLAKLLSAGEA